MEEEKITRTTVRGASPTGHVVQESVKTEVEADQGEFAVAKLNQVVWYVLALIMIILGLRFLFLLLGAANTGIVSFIYSLSSIFIAPFVGIFKSPTFGASFFDSAALVGIVFYLILGFIITSLINLFSKRTE